MDKLRIIRKRVGDYGSTVQPTIWAERIEAAREEGLQRYQRFLVQCKKEAVFRAKTEWNVSRISAIDFHVNKERAIEEGANMARSATYNFEIGEKMTQKIMLRFEGDAMIRFKNIAGGNMRLLLPGLDWRERLDSQISSYEMSDHTLVKFTWDGSGDTDYFLRKIHERYPTLKVREQK